MQPSKLPLTIRVHVVSDKTLLLTAIVGNQDVTSERLLLGSGTGRRKLAKKWAADPRLNGGTELSVEAVSGAIDEAEQDARAAIANAVEAETADTDDMPGRAENKESQATMVVNLAHGMGIELWHTASGEAWATIPMGGHHEHWPCRSKALRRWLSHLFFVEYGKTPGSQAIQDALGVLEGEAIFAGRQHDTHIRIAELAGALYLDLCDEEWRAIRIGPNGWELLEKPPIKFRRTRGMSALPVPERRGSLTELRRFVNVDDEESWIMMVSWLIGAFAPRGPYPILIVNGEQGCAKSTTCRVLRAMIDPNDAPLRSEPRDEHDLVIAANNAWVISLENISRLLPWVSDALCRIATGGGFATRQLYSDAEETIFAAQRPIMVNGIEELAIRSDLLDRAIQLPLPPISEDERRVESALWSEFLAARPRILGAILDAVSMALRRYASVRLERLPRMADFVQWVVAAEAALPWPPSSFLTVSTWTSRKSH